MLNWDDLRFFIHLSNLGSLSATARKLKVDHTTVSRRISSLEQALGLKLFDRMSQGYVLTAEGERLRLHVEKLSDGILALQRQALGEGAGLEGKVRISAPPAFSSRFLVPRLGRLRQCHPGIVLEVIGTNSSASLTQREADIAIRMFRPEGMSLVVRRIATAGYGLYAARALLERIPLADMNLLGYEESLAHVPQQLWLRKYAGARPIVFSTNDLSALASAVAAGLGAAVLPHFVAYDQPDLACLVEEDVPARDIWLVVHEDVRHSPRVRAVLDEIAALAADARGVLENPSPLHSGIVSRGD